MPRNARLQEVVLIQTTRLFGKSIAKGKMPTLLLVVGRRAKEIKARKEKAKAKEKEKEKDRVNGTAKIGQRVQVHGRDGTKTEVDPHPQADQALPKEQAPHLPVRSTGLHAQNS